MPKESRISVKIDDALKARLESAIAKTSLGEPSLIRALAQALCEYVEDHGEITIPLAILPKSEWLKLKNRSQDSNIRYLAPAQNTRIADEDDPASQPE